MKKEQIQSLAAAQLQALINSTTTNGRFSNELHWAKEELQRRSLVSCESVSDRFFSGYCDLLERASAGDF